MEAGSSSSVIKPKNLFIDDRCKANEINRKGLIAFVRDEIAKGQPLKKIPWIRKLFDLPKGVKRYETNNSI